MLAPSPRSVAPWRMLAGEQESHDHVTRSARPSYVPPNDAQERPPTGAEGALDRQGQPASFGKVGLLCTRLENCFSLAGVVMTQELALFRPLLK
jgi:hypothetical protein